MDLLVAFLCSAFLCAWVSTEWQFNLRWCERRGVSVGERTRQGMVFLIVLGFLGLLATFTLAVLR